MTRYRIIIIAFFTTIWLLGGFVSPSLANENLNWILRAIASDVATENVDVMVGPDGEIIVGYASPASGTSTVNLTVARLPAGTESFQYRTESNASVVASFAADRFGNVFYAGRNNSGAGIRVGQDFGGYGDLLSSYHPDSGTVVSSAVPTMAVSPGGMPYVATMDQSGGRFLSAFNAAEERWQTEIVTGLGLDSPAMPAGTNCQSLTFDASGKPVLTYVRQTGDPVKPLVVAMRGAFGWENVANDAAQAMFGTSVAAAPDGTIGFAYVNGSGKLSFNSYEGELGIRETIADRSGKLMPHSLAFDNEGNPAIVYGWYATTPTPLHLARCNALGEWTDEELPVNGPFASLTFDSRGKPLIAAYSYDNSIILLNVVPEPNAIFLGISGALAFLAYFWRSRRM